MLIDVDHKWHLGKPTEILFMLPSQTWVYKPVHSRANVLTPGCGERKYSVYCKVKQGKQAANAQKTQAP